MDLKEAERRYLHLKKLHERGELDESTFRFEAAKLMVRDDQGAFWMVDPVPSQWYRNDGSGWMEADPETGADAVPSATVRRSRPPGRRHTMSVVGALLILFLLAAVVFVMARWPAFFWGSSTPTSTAGEGLQVTIASPSPDTIVALGQEVAVEVTLRAEPNLQLVDRVDLQVDGQIVESRSVGTAVQTGQASLPLSLPWRSGEMGDHDLTVVAWSAAGDALGQATVRIQVAQAPREALPEPACTPDAVFLSHVTIPPATAFQPGARMDKVWQVRNSGTCAWGVGYELVRMAGDSFGTDGSEAVPPAGAGDRLNLEVTLWAPVETGVYTSAWQLRTPAGVAFGPTLTVDIEVEALAEAAEPPAVPGLLRAELADDGHSVILTWQDLSDNEDAFRIYRDDVEASIGLVPADTTVFVDRSVACGNTYRYRVAAFNAAGPSPSYRTPPVVMPACVVADTPPTLTLTAEPSQVVPGTRLQLLFRATDDAGVAQVMIQGEDTGDSELDSGHVFSCARPSCTGNWTLEVTPNLSGTLTFLGLATDTVGQMSEPVHIEVVVLPE